MTPTKTTTNALAIANGFMDAGQQLLRESGCEVSYHSALKGAAHTYRDDWLIEVPVPTTALRFAIFAHEVGHQMLHRDSNKVRWLEEWEAWSYALDQFQRFRLPDVDDAELRAAKSMRHAVRKAMRRGSANLAEQIVDMLPAWVWTLGDPPAYAIPLAIQYDLYMSSPPSPQTA